MSAIYGTLLLNGKVTPETSTIMETPYRENCRIDRYSSLTHKSCFMGCGIQYFTAEAVNEQLPLHHPQKNFLMTADCLLDNRDELIEALSMPSSTPDGTLLFEAYAKWGLTFLNHLRGLFSIAIYEPETETLYLVTDQLAARCLYYYKDADSITFSTLLAPILRLHPEITYNEFFLKDFLTAPGLMPQITSTDTPYQNVYKCNPGTYLKITKDTITEQRYWSPQNHPTPACSTSAQYGSAFRKLYEDCIRDALRTDGDIGISMSSGLDSASVGALAAIELAKAKRPLYTYTYVPCEQASSDRNRNNVHNEQPDVLSITSAYPNMHPRFLTNNGKNCYEDLETELAIMEIPFKAFENMPSLCEIFREASSNGCKVVLSGQLGNSTVSHGYIDDVLFDFYQKKKPLSMLSYLNHYARTVKESRMKALRGCLGYFRFSKQEMGNPDFRYQPDNPFLSDTIFQNYPAEKRYRQSLITGNARIPMPSHTYSKWVYHASALTYLGELETKMGLAYGILLRDPTKDMRMIAFCYHLPYKYFAYQGIPRWLIRSNLTDVLPATLLNNWLRYGVQNSDCFNRIRRDWSCIYDKLKQISDSDFTQDSSETSMLYQRLISPDKVNAYLNQNQSTPSAKDRLTFMHITYLYILYCVLNK